MDSLEPTSQPPRSQRGVLIVFFLLCSLGAAALCFWLLSDELRLPAQFRSIKAQDPQPQPEQYEVLKQALKEHQNTLSQRYKTARTEAEKNAIIEEARTALETTTPKMMRCWLSTKWDFHGTSETPGEGAIACGYYVSTIMRDAGFHLPRIKLSQQASQTILGAFVPRKKMLIRTGMNYQQFHDMVLALPPGIYIIGLDKHVGFLVHTGTELQFIHSSGGSPKKVVLESKENATAIQRSHYRVIGNVTMQDATLKKWLLKQPVYPVE